MWLQTADKGSRTIQTSSDLEKTNDAELAHLLISVLRRKSEGGEDAAQIYSFTRMKNFSLIGGRVKPVPVPGKSTTTWRIGGGKDWQGAAMEALQVLLLQKLHWNFRRKKFLPLPGQGIIMVLRGVEEAQFLDAYNGRGYIGTSDIVSAAQLTDPPMGYPPENLATGYIRHKYTYSRARKALYINLGEFNTPEVAELIGIAFHYNYRVAITLTMTGMVNAAVEGAAAAFENGFDAAVETVIKFVVEAIGKAFGKSAGEYIDSLLKERFQSNKKKESPITADQQMDDLFARIIKVAQDGDPTAILKALGEGGE